MLSILKTVSTLANTSPFKHFSCVPVPMCCSLTVVASPCEIKLGPCEINLGQEYPLNNFEMSPQERILREA